MCFMGSIGCNRTDYELKKRVVMGGYDADVAEKAVGS